MSSLIPENELQTFKSNNYRLIFCIGIQGSGIDSQIEKVSNEFKYAKLVLHEVIQKEIDLNTEIGKRCKEYIEKNELLPNDILTYLIIHYRLENKDKNTILINGFPNKLEDSQYFEQNISPIELILKFNATEETCLKNLSEDK